MSSPPAPAKVMIAVPARLRARLRDLQARLAIERQPAEARAAGEKPRQVTIPEALEYLIEFERAGRKAP